VLRDCGCYRVEPTLHRFEKVARQLVRRVPRVQAAIQQTLGTAPANITTVAAMLSMHPRTLQRRLTAEKTGFATLLDDVRRHAARHYPDRN
jgi:AraC-like DNA-binding protein